MKENKKSDLNKAVDEPKKADDPDKRQPDPDDPNEENAIPPKEMPKNIPPSHDEEITDYDFIANYDFIAK